MSSITFQQNILFPPAMYHNQLRHDHATPVSFGTSQSLPYPFIQHVSFNQMMAFGNQDYTHNSEANIYPVNHPEGVIQQADQSDSTYIAGLAQSVQPTNQTEVHRNSCMKYSISESSSDTDSPANSPQQCDLAPTSPHRLTLPNIRVSDNFAKNVMSEESDLGYYSFCDMNDMKLEDMSPNTTSGQTNFSAIIDDVLDSLDEQMFALHSARQQPRLQSEKDELSSTQTRGQTSTQIGTHNSQTQFMPCTFQNVILNFQNSSPEVAPVSWSRDVEQSEHSCHTCSKYFGSKQDLSTHMRVHKDGRPHKCLYCHKSFTQKSTLRTHIRTHTGEKPFSCPSCARAFSDYSTYRKHLRIHSGEKPYVCDVCKKSFTQSGNMIRHREIHFKKIKGAH